LLIGIKSIINRQTTKTKIIKLKEPLSPHLKITLPFDFNFYLIKPYERNDYFKSTLSGEASDF